MADAINVELAFDPDAEVWFVKHSDVRGLRLEAATVDALIERLPGALQDLLNAADGELDVLVEVIAHRSTRVRFEAA